MRARPLALAALILAAPAPAVAAPLTSDTTTPAPLLDPPTTEQSNTSGRTGIASDFPVPATTAPMPQAGTTGTGAHTGQTTQQPGAQPLPRGADPTAVLGEAGIYYWWSTTGSPHSPTLPMTWSWYGSTTTQPAPSTPQVASQASAVQPLTPAVAPAPVVPQAPVVSSRFIPAQTPVTPGTVTVVPPRSAAQTESQPQPETAPVVSTGLYRAVAAGLATAVVATAAVVVMMRRMILPAPLR